jgi:hypothetical protein
VQTVAGEFDLAGFRTEQSRDGGVESEGEGGKFRGCEGPLPAFGLVDGLPAPRLSQIAAIAADPHWRQAVENEAGSTQEWCRQRGLT